MMDRDGLLRRAGTKLWVSRVMSQRGGIGDHVRAAPAGLRRRVLSGPRYQRVAFGLPKNAAAREAAHLGKAHAL